MELFDDFALGTNIIGGAWQVFGRDAKIESIVKNISSRFS